MVVEIGVVVVSVVVGVSGVVVVSVVVVVIGVVVVSVVVVVNGVVVVYVVVVVIGVVVVSVVIVVTGVFVLFVVVVVSEAGLVTPEYFVVLCACRLPGGGVSCDIFDAVCDSHCTDAVVVFGSDAVFSENVSFDDEPTVGDISSRVLVFSVFAELWSPVVVTVTHIVESDVACVADLSSFCVSCVVVLVFVSISVVVPLLLSMPDVEIPL